MRPDILRIVLWGGW